MNKVTNAEFFKIYMFEMASNVITLSILSIALLCLGVFLLIRSNIAQTRREEAANLEQKEKYAKIKLFLQAGSTLATFLAGIATYTFIGETTTHFDQLIISPQITMKAIAPNDDNTSVFIYAVYFENGKSEIPPTQKTELQNLIGKLLPCGDAANPVVLNVHGYASSSRFSPDLEQTNFQLANARARAVADSITDVGSSLALVVNSESWANTDHLGRSRVINDLVEDQGQATEMEQINRVALISLSSAGLCEAQARGWVKTSLNTQ